MANDASDIKSSQADAWMWLEGGTQQGPLSSEALIKFMQNKDQLHPTLPSLLVWKVGSEKWVPAIDIDMFREHVHALSSQWFYADPLANGGRSAPLSIRQLAKVFEGGELDGLSMLFGQSLDWSSPSWTPLSDIPAVKSAIASYSAGEDEVEDTSINESDMVYNRAEEPRIDSAQDDQDDKIKNEENHYVADDGTCFVSDTNGEWVEFSGTDDEWIELEKKEEKSTAENKNSIDKEQKRDKKKKKSKKNKWSDKAQTDHNWVYIEGIPTDATVEEVALHFSKCGVIAIDPRTSEPRVKLYRDPTSQLNKGDGSVCYANADSVPLAIQVLDGGRLRTNAVISVKKAEFNLKGDSFDPSKRAKVSSAAKKVAKAAEAQSLTWDEDDDGGRKAGLKIVVLMGMFEICDFDDENFENELTTELGTELEEKVGEPEKMTLFTKNPQGVVVVKFKTAYSAAECIKLMHNRFFAGRQLTCTYWDGVTDYTVEVAEEVEEQRIEQFGDWIEEQELPAELQLQVEE